MNNARNLVKLLLIVLFLHGGASHAMLVNRGGGMIYDDVLDITWLSNANLGTGSVYDTLDGNADGLIFGARAILWASELVYGGFDDWRLPNATYTTTSGQQCYYNCTDSELGYMFYINLGVTAGSGVLSSSSPNMQLFENLTNGVYWNGISDPISTDMGSFRMSDGLQSRHSMNYNYSAWAVRDGDVTTIPEPNTLYLLIFIGLLPILRFTNK